MEWLKEAQAKIGSVVKRGREFALQSLRSRAPPGTEFDEFAAPVGRQLDTWGKRRSLLIGINYIGQKGELSGCINDVKTMQHFLQQQGWPSDAGSQRVLTDDQRGAGRPTLANMRDGLRWLVDGAEPGDCLFLHFSGHGSQKVDTNGDEDDGYDETLVPVDHQSAGHLVDDEIFDVVVRPLPKGCKLTALFDCCHSGTAMDLPYVFKASGDLSAGPPPRMRCERGETWSQRVSLQSQRARSIGRAPNTESPMELREVKGHVGEVVMFSGCADRQTSADVGGDAAAQFGHSGPRGAGGACTNALVAAVSKRPEGLTFVELLDAMRIALRERRFEQVPQLSSSLPVDLRQPFSLTRLLMTGADTDAPPPQQQQPPAAAGGFPPPPVSPTVAPTPLPPPLNPPSQWTAQQPPPPPAGGEPVAVQTLPSELFTPPPIPVAAPHPPPQFAAAPPPQFAAAPPPQFAAAPPPQFAAPLPPPPAHSPPYDGAEDEPFSPAPGWLCVPDPAEAPQKVQRTLSKWGGWEEDGSRALAGRSFLPELRELYNAHYAEKHRSQIENDQKSSPQVSANLVGRAQRALNRSGWEEKPARVAAAQPGCGLVAPDETFSFPADTHFWSSLVFNVRTFPGATDAPHFSIRATHEGRPVLVNQDFLRRFVDGWQQLNPHSVMTSSPRRGVGAHDGRDFWAGRTA